MSEIIKPLMLDETGKAIVEALTQQEMTQTRIAEINATAETAKAGIEAKTDEQAARIPEVTELAKDVTNLKQDLDDIGVRVYNLEHGGAGVTTDMRDSLWVIIQKAAYATPLTDAEKNAFINAWHIGDDPGREVMRIEVVYSGESEIAVGTDVETLRSNLTVTAYYTDFTHETVLSYTISGEIEAGQNTITVTYHGKSATFNVSGKVPEPIDTQPVITEENKSWNSASTSSPVQLQTRAGMGVVYEKFQSIENLIPSDAISEFGQFTSTLALQKYAPYIIFCQSKTNYVANGYPDSGHSRYCKIGILLNGSPIYYSGGPYDGNEKMCPIYSTGNTSSIFDNCIKANKLFFDVFSDDIDDAYAFWTHYIGATTPNPETKFPDGVSDGDIIFAGRNTKYYGMRNISEYKGD